MLASSVQAVVACNATAPRVLQCFSFVYISEKYNHACDYTILEKVLSSSIFFNERVVHTQCRTARNLRTRWTGPEVAPYTHAPGCDRE